jgi:hypothetical protein
VEEITMTVELPTIEPIARTIPQFELVSAKPRRREDVVRLITTAHAEGLEDEDEALEITRLIEERLASGVNEADDTDVVEFGRRVSFVRQRFSRRSFGTRRATGGTRDWTTFSTWRPSPPAPQQRSQADFTRGHGS